MARPSPLFLAGLDAHHALEQLAGKLRNVRRRELTRSEQYALALVDDRYDELTELLDQRAIAGPGEVASDGR